MGGQGGTNGKEGKRGEREIMKSIKLPQLWQPQSHSTIVPTSHISLPEEGIIICFITQTISLPSHPLPLDAFGVSIALPLSR